MEDHEDEPTCGRGLAASAVVPAALAAVAAGLSQNLDVHLHTLDPGDSTAAQERHVYERVTDNLLSAVTDLRAAAEEMAAAVDLPMGPHDLTAMTPSDVLEAFERYVAAENDLRRLLEERREGNEQMITMIRAAIGNSGTG